MQSLKHKKTINKIFSAGKRIFNKSPYPLIISTIDSDIKGIVICVSKKNFKKAVDRNKVKRYVREGLKGKTAEKAIAIIYNSNKLPDKALIDQVSNLIF